MVIPLNITDKQFQGVASHRANFERRFSAFSAAHNIDSGFHEKLTFKKAPAPSPAPDTTKLFFNNAKEIGFVKTDGQEAALRFLQKESGVSYKKSLNIAPKAVVSPVMQNGRLIKFSYVGSDVQPNIVNGQLRAGAVVFLTDKFQHVELISLGSDRADAVTKDVVFSDSLY